jgi:hypothetical protein
MKKVLSTIVFASRADSACAMKHTKTFKQKKFSLKLISLALALLSSSSAETSDHMDHMCTNEVCDEAAAQRTEALQTVVKCLDSCRDNDKKKWKTGWKGILQSYVESNSNPMLGERLKLLNLDLVNPNEQAQNALDPNLHDFVKNVVRVNCLVERKKDSTFARSNGTFTGGIGTGTLISLLTKEERKRVNSRALEQNPDLEKLKKLATFDGRVVLTCAHCLTNSGGIVRNIFCRNTKLQTPGGKLELSRYNSPGSEDPYERTYLSITPMDSFRDDNVFVPIIKSTAEHDKCMCKVQEFYMQGDDMAIIILDKQVPGLEGFPLQYEQTGEYCGQCAKRDTPDYSMDFVVGLG